MSQEKIERHHRIISRRKFLGALIGGGGVVLTGAGLDALSRETVSQGAGPGPSSFFQLFDVSRLQPKDGDVWAYQASNRQWLNQAPTALTSFLHKLLSTQHSDTVPASAVAGDLIVADATPLWARLPIGTSGQVLQVVGGLPAWGASVEDHKFLIDSSDTTPGFLSPKLVIDSNVLSKTIQNVGGNENILLGLASLIVGNIHFSGSIFTDSIFGQTDSKQIVSSTSTYLQVNDASKILQLHGAPINWLDQGQQQNLVLENRTSDTANPTTGLIYALNLSSDPAFTKRPRYLPDSVIGDAHHLAYRDERILQTQALPGTVVQINDDEGFQSISVPNTDTNIKTFSLPVNTYSKVKTTVDGTITLNPKALLQQINLKIKYGGVQVGNTMNFEAPSAVLSVYPYSFAVQGAQTGAVTIALTGGAPAADTLTLLNVNRMTVEGVV